MVIRFVVNTLSLTKVIYAIRYYSFMLKANFTPPIIDYFESIKFQCLPLPQMRIQTPSLLEAIDNTN